jgi:hypothetical protein
MLLFGSLGAALFNDYQHAFQPPFPNLLCTFSTHRFWTIRRPELLVRLWAKVDAYRGLACDPFSLTAAAMGCRPCSPSQVAGTFQVTGLQVIIFLAVFLMGFVFFSHLDKQLVRWHIGDRCNGDMEVLPCSGIRFEAIGILFSSPEYSLNTGSGSLDVSGNTTSLLRGIVVDRVSQLTCLFQNYIRSTNRQTNN